MTVIRPARHSTVHIECGYCGRGNYLTLSHEGYYDSPVVLPKDPKAISKLKLFIEIFNALTGEERNDVTEKDFIDELLNTGKFSGDEARSYLGKAIENGQLFEKTDGILAKT
jgi:replicative DNA helicase Mcm